MSEVNPQELRNAFGTFMTGVTVVTAQNKHAQNQNDKSSNENNCNFSHVGFTANSFTSVSLDPPLLSVCLGKSLNYFSIFENCSHFAINILAEDQEEISNLFAYGNGDRLSKVGWSADSNGSPIIEGVTTSFSCSNYRQVDAGDHMILIGEIDSFETSGEEGLGYSNRGYFSLGSEKDNKA